MLSLRLFLAVRVFPSPWVLGAFRVVPFTSECWRSQHQRHVKTTPPPKQVYSYASVAIPRALFGAW